MFLSHSTVEATLISTRTVPLAWTSDVLAYWICQIAQIRNLQKDPTTVLQCASIVSNSERKTGCLEIRMTSLNGTWGAVLDTWLRLADLGNCFCVYMEVYPVYPSFPKKQLSSFVSQATSPLTEFSQHQRFFSSLQSVFHELSFAKQLKGTWAKKLSLMGSSVQDVFVLRKRDLMKPVLDRSIEILKTIKPQSFSLFKA